MRTLSCLAVAAGLAALVTAPANAQQAAAPHRQHWGPQVSYDFTNSNVGVGARLEYSLSRLLGSQRVDGIGELNWYPGTVNVFDLGYNVVYRFQSPAIQPYAGGGLAFWVATGNGNTASQLHLNAVGGLKLKPMGRVTPVVQLRYVFVQGDALVLTGGILF